MAVKGYGFVSNEDGDESHPEQEQKPWDAFLDTPRPVVSGSMADMSFFDRAEKIMKIVAYILIFLIVLTAAVISKGTLLFMTSQVKETTRAYCNEDLGRNKQFVVRLPETVRLPWIWMLLVSYYTPQFLIFIRSLWKCLFKGWDLPTMRDFSILFATETFPPIGCAMMAYAILPELDVVKGAMLTNAFCVVPGIISCTIKILKKKKKNKGEFMWDWEIVPDVASVFAQLSALFIWPALENESTLWFTPIAVIFISIGYWENFAKEPDQFEKYIEQGKTRHMSYVIISLWKCAVFLGSMVLIFFMKEGDAGFLFNGVSDAFANKYLNVTEVMPVIYEDSSPNVDEIVEIGDGVTVSINHLSPVWVWLIHVLVSWVCYIFGLLACKIMLQPFSFAFPINLVMPVTISALVAMSGEFIRDECSYTNTIPPHLFFNVPPVYFLKDFLGNQQAWIWLIWALSQAWITRHIWFPKVQRMAPSEELFIKPFYEGFMIDQDMAMNRRCEDIIVEDPIQEDDTSDDTIPKVYACGTMWHENKEEMMEFLKSIIRLDNDQCARRIAKIMYSITEDYYELETHIFFDDAFTRTSEKDMYPKVNTYVRYLVDGVTEAARNVHQNEMLELDPPKMYDTPYGGRLEWTLPGNTKMIAHLKDKAFIRPKKRWSQVMYMYYLLGHRLVEAGKKHEEDERIRIQSRNTFILALDGDIDFQPNALHLLLDLMKKNKSVGAACGRIHPTGSGPMVWYQMFEYAVGHWMQKATEHVIGCVLCSPGCFSLFRGAALMDDNVMRKYTTRSSEALHFVQYDQGEDRWLCTLLLQRGWRVEYSAASDAFTHSPEGFDEFYNQRRRWMPSTTANIIDLLNDSKRTVQNNKNISTPYILYQTILMIGTVLGCGTIFLMLVGAFVAAFQMDQWTSFWYNVIPILLFSAVCKLFDSKIQLFFALALSAGYGLVMMAVLVGVMLQISEDGWTAPSSLFFFFMFGEFVVAAIIHPKEFGCLKFALVYYITVPSMYMLLVIYSVFNMNNVSWGTREVTIVAKPQAPKNEKPEEKLPETKEKKKMFGLFDNPAETSGAFEIAISSCFRCMLCTSEKNSVEKYQLEEIKTELSKIKNMLDDLAKGVDAIESEPLPRQSVAHLRRSTATFMQGPNAIETKEETYGTVSSESTYSEVDERHWKDDDIFNRSENYILKPAETQFWKDVIEKYLAPIDDTADQARIKRELAALRDKTAAGFYLVNSLFVLVIFLMTLKKETLHLNWPFNVKTTFEYNPDDRQITMEKEYLQLEPIGFVILIFFFSLMAVQFVAMFIHRFGTFCQILSNTNIQKEKGLDEVEEIMRMQQLKNDEHDELFELPPDRRSTFVGPMSTRPRRTENKLEDAFIRRITKIEHAHPSNSTEAYMLRRRTRATLYESQS